MNYFNMDTGEISDRNSTYSLPMRKNITPYYDLRGLYFGCKCRTDCTVSSTDYFNPATDKFVATYDQLGL